MGLPWVKSQCRAANNWCVLATFLILGFMRTKGLEPSHLSILEPKSSASTNSATSAFATVNYNSIDFCFKGCFSGFR